ncbi:MAG: hypothetical protein GWO20_15775 [Candidatus Korarchaeota archaeon]|nr:hypothetical protein [Candidatus Korarchaeota archaeon]NIU84930.1 hypothetical protein [Candidatus Thorarchaeota archaeon]NIW14947.1 hypothetical protein [Candidatus Thorarchaeota archaeon]NIW52914.1 hypothetical protein [Candidatus Korarchaeota archaeon]
MQKSVTNAIIHTSASLVPRMERYLGEKYGEQSNTVDTFVFLETIDKQSFLEALLHDELKVWRYINRLYFYDFRSQEYQQLLNLNFNKKTIRIQAYPPELEERLLKELEPSIELNPKTFTHFLSVALLKNTYHYGLYPKKLFFRRPKPSPSVASSYYKINEAVHRFNVPLPPTSRVLDLGAAPGGWTEYMSKKVEKVIAVDPANLDFDRKNVIHLSNKVEECLTEIRRYAPYDMIMCDINQDPREVARVIAQVAPLLSPQGFLIMTIKLVLKGKETRSMLITRTKELLANHFEHLQVTWLLANTKWEKTLFGIKKER